MSLFDFFSFDLSYAKITSVWCHLNQTMEMSGWQKELNIWSIALAANIEILAANW